MPSKSLRLVWVSGDWVSGNQIYFQQPRSLSSRWPILEPPSENEFLMLFSWLVLFRYNLRTFYTKLDELHTVRQWWMSWFICVGWQGSTKRKPLILKTRRSSQLNRSCVVSGNFDSKYLPVRVCCQPYTIVRKLRPCLDNFYVGRRSTYLSTVLKGSRH